MVLPQTRLTVKTFALAFPTKISAYKLTDACLCAVVSNQQFSQKAHYHLPLCYCFQSTSQPSSSLPFAFGLPFLINGISQQAHRCLTLWCQFQSLKQPTSAQKLALTKEISCNQREGPHTSLDLLYKEPFTVHQSCTIAGFAS
jgi:hypothetical protein